MCGRVQKERNGIRKDGANKELLMWKSKLTLLDGVKLGLGMWLALKVLDFVGFLFDVVRVLIFGVSAGWRI